MTDATLKVGAVRFASEIGDVDANVGILLRWIEAGRDAGLDLLVTPEVSLTGHNAPERLLRAAMKRDDPRLRRLAEAAGDMTVVVGFIEEGPAAQFSDASAILRAGRVRHLHREVNLPDRGRLEEGKHYASDRFVDTYALSDDRRGGLLLCADMWNPTLPHLAFLHGNVPPSVRVPRRMDAARSEDNAGRPRR